MSRFLNGAVRVLFVITLLAVAGCGDESPRERRASGATGTVDSVAASEFAEAEPITRPSKPLSFLLAPGAGDRFSYRIEQNSTTDLGGRKIEDFAVYHFTLSVTGRNDDGSLTAELRYDSIRIRRTFGAGIADSVPRTIAFDTRTKTKEPVPGSEQYAALIGRKINLTLDREGEVEEVSNLDPIINAIVGDRKDKLQPQERETLRQLVRVQAVSSMIQQLFLQEVPDSAVLAGREWSRTDTSRQMGIRANSRVRYKLTDVREVDDRPVGRVEVGLTTKFLERKVDNQMVSASIDEATVEGGGEALIHMDDGFPISKKTSIEMRMKLTGSVKLGPQQGKTETIEQAVITRTNVQLVSFVPGGTD